MKSEGGRALKHTFRGGVHPNEKKELSSEVPLRWFDPKGELIQGGHDENRRGGNYFWNGFPVRLSSAKSALDRGEELTPDGPEFDEFVAFIQSPTEALLIPQAYRQFINEEMMPYIRGEKSWEDCWKSFLNTVELYKDE